MKQSLCHIDIPWCVRVQRWRFSDIARVFVQTDSRFVEKKIINGDNGYGDKPSVNNGN